MMMVMMMMMMMMLLMLMMMMMMMMIIIMLTIKILFTINSLEKKKRINYSFKTLFTILFDLKSTQFSLERVNLTKKNLFE